MLLLRWSIESANKLLPWIVMLTKCGISIRDVIKAILLKLLNKSFNFVKMYVIHNK